jgi:hypothetical protein
VPPTALAGTKTSTAGLGGLAPCRHDGSLAEDTPLGGS